MTWATEPLAQAEVALAYAEALDEHPPSMGMAACSCNRCSDIRERRRWWRGEVRRLRDRT